MPESVKCSVSTEQIRTEAISGLKLFVKPSTLSNVKKLYLSLFWLLNSAILGAIPTLEDLLSMSPEELEKVDIAIINLRCAEGLPGSETIDWSSALNDLDQLADYLAMLTKDYLFLYSKDPTVYNNNVDLFRMAIMQSILKRNCGIVYSPYRTNAEPAETFFDDSKDIF